VKAVSSATADSSVAEPAASEPVAAGGGRQFSDEDLARLPGPRRHLDILEADLRAGHSCVWYFPDSVVESGRADFFVRELTHRLEAVIPVPGVVSHADRRVGPASVPAPRPPNAAEPNEPGADTDLGQDTITPEDPYTSLLRRLAAPGSSARSSLAPATAMPTATLEERLAKELGATSDPVGTLAAQAAAGHVPHVIVVRCWDESSPEEAARLLRVAQATFHEAGLTGRARPRFLLAARAADLSRAALGGQGRATIHWWWKVWSRLDTEVLMAWRSRSGVTDASHTLLRRVTDAVVAEVCGPDLDRALTLRALWDGGDLGTLRQALGQILPEPAAGSAEPMPPRRLSTAHASAPDAEIHAAWARGAVDSWDGRIHPSHGRSLLDAGSQELRVLVCHAQNRVLLPLIEEARTSLIHLVPGILRTQRFTLQDFCEKARSQHWRPTDEAAVPDLEELELGGLSHAAYMLALTTTQRHRLRTLHTARNTLSHRTPLGHEQLVSLAQVLTTDWTAR
jgi:hypothetical protein